ncbi:MAG: type II secretion system protein GspD [Fimbriimonas sp.]
MLLIHALSVTFNGPVPGHIASVVANKVGTGVELVVKGEGLQKPRIFPFLNGKMRVVEFDANMAGRGGKTTVNKGGVRSYNTFWYRSTPPKIRINVRLDKSLEPTLIETESGWKLGFGTGQPLASNVGSEEEGLLVLEQPKTAKSDPFPNTVPPLDTVKKEKPVVEEAPVNTEPVKTTKTLAVKNDFPSTVPPLEKVKKPELKTLASYAPQTADNVSIDFVNTDIVQVLKAVAIQANVNIVTSPDVKGVVTVSLRNVTVDDALKIVTSLGALGYAKVGATFIVAPADKIDAIRRSITGEAAPTLPGVVKEPVVMLRYNVKGGLAADLVKAVDEDDKGKAGNLMLTGTPPDSLSAQTIVIRGPRNEAEEMVKVLEQLDNPELGSASATDILEVKYLDPRALREELIAAFPGLRASIVPGPAGNPRLYTANQQKAQINEAQDPRAGQGTGTGAGSSNGEQATGGDQRAGSSLRTGAGQLGEREQRGLVQPFQDFESVAYPMKLVLRGPAAQIAQARAYATQLDVMPKQIALELRVMEMTKNDAERIGLDWSILTTGGVLRALRLNQGLGGTPDTPGTVSAATRNESVVATLDSMANRQNLIARPNLLAMDGRETEVFVGDVIRYIEAIQSTQNGITVQTNEVRVGVRLAVLARSGGGDNITMDLRPVLSFLRGFTPTPGGGNLPQTSERISQSTAVMKSGETIALGGLIQDTDRNNVSGIPILRDLPIIGALFRRTEKSKDRSEVVFFLTARVVDEKTRQDAASPKRG